MNWETSLVRYTSIKLDNQDVELENNYRVSFSPPYNKIAVTFETYPNHSLSYYEVRITKEDEGYDIGIGSLAYSASPVAADVPHNFYIDVNSTTFNKGMGSYRVSLYAKSAIDGVWDVTCLLFTLNDGCYLQLSDGSILGVGTDRDIPSK